MLVERTNLLVIEGRRVGTCDFSAEAAGALDSTHIQELIAAQRPTFNAGAAALREGRSDVALGHRRAGPAAAPNSSSMRWST
jgi:hypothetical protein